MLICKPQSGYITRLFNSDTLCMDAEAKVYLHNTYIVTDKTYNLRSTHFKTKSKCKNHNCFLLLMSISRHLSNWHSLAGCSIMFKLLNIMKYRKKYTPASSSLWWVYRGTWALWARPRWTRRRGGGTAHGTGGCRSAAGRYWARCRHRSAAWTPSARSAATRGMTGPEIKCLR